MTSHRAGLPPAIACSSAIARSTARSWLRRIDAALEALAGIGDAGPSGARDPRMASGAKYADFEEDVGGLGADARCARRP